MKFSSFALILPLSFGVASAARLQASSSRAKMSIVINGPAARSSTNHPHDAHPHDAGRVLKEETAPATEVDDEALVGTCGQCMDTNECALGHLCVTAAASGCFNFDVSGMYCAPVYIPADSASSVTGADPTIDIGSLIVGDANAGAEDTTDASEIVTGDVETPSEPTFAPSVGGTTVEPTAAPTVPLCGQCKSSGDCLPSYACVGAAASGCFNFDVSGDDRQYCVPASTTSGPTVAATDEATEDVATVEPTVAPTIAGTSAEPTVAPTIAGTSAEPTVAPTVAGTDGATTTEPTPPPTYATIRWIGGDPSITLQACEGDCDDDDDCEGNLVCMQRSGDEPIPGCGGDISPRSEADYCVRPAEPEIIDAEEFDVSDGIVVASIETMPSSKASAVGCVATAAALGMAATMLLLMLGYV